MSNLLRDIRYALRLMRQAPGFTLAAVLALSLGIGATTALFSVVYAVLLRPLPFPEADRLLVLGADTVRPQAQRFSFFQFDAIAEQSTQFSSLTAYGNQLFNLTGEGDAEQVRGAVVEGAFFETFGIASLLGRTLTPEEREAPQVVLSQSLWQRLGGRRELVGRTLTLGGQPYTVVGVMPSAFQVPDARTLLWVNHASLPGAASSPARTLRSFHGFIVNGRLAPGATLASARAELATIAARLAQEFPDTQSQLRLSAVGYRDQLVGNVRLLLLVLLGAVALVLMIAAVNVAHLQLARAAGRAREFGIRVALGASRGQLVRQLLTESIILCLLGAGGGVLLAMWGTDLLLALGASALPRGHEVTVDGRVLLFAVAVALVTGVGVGLIPALQRSRLTPQAMLGHNATEVSRGRTHGGLVVAEVALALVLVIGAGLMLKSFWRLHQVEPGVDSEGVFVARLVLSPDRYQEPARIVGFYTALRERLAMRPEVASSGLSLSLPPGGDQRRTSFTWEGAPESNAPPSTLYVITTPGFLETLRVPLREGRTLAEADKASTEPVLVVSEAFVRQFLPGQEAVGRRVTFRAVGGQPEWRTIVGVVGDVAYSGFEQGLEPTVYVPQAQDPHPGGFLVVRAARGLEASKLASVVRSELRALDAGVPLAQADTLEAMLEAGLGQPRFRTVLLGTFGLLALVLAAVGIYGVMSYAVAQRSREMGIRMALGARREDVLRLVVGQSLRRVGLGVGVGLVGAVAARHLLEGFLHGVGGLDASVFVGVPALLTAVALAASWLPAHRAASADPADVLRRG
ncbi:ABC transporter permease [Hyalangium rubrum]|uniref:ABC transporter permease n=1 Tax=Hyalangium rubrum TaxID=3103134 RepID=A0ABU5H4G8_9BACT|nr:ABC transporter permease [Hyalangium sp. s54d21]MDY7228206.1 ABC transporter permease [Hyalangium sp. s54d21]